MQNKNWPYLSRADIQHTLYTYSTRCNVVYSLLKLCVVCQIDKDNYGNFSCIKCENNN